MYTNFLATPVTFRGTEFPRLLTFILFFSSKPIPPGKSLYEVNQTKVEY